MLQEPPQQVPDCRASLPFRGHVDAAWLLIKHSVDAAAQSKGRTTTPLHEASFRGSCGCGLAPHQAQCRCSSPEQGRDDDHTASGIQMGSCGYGLASHQAQRQRGSPERAWEDVMTSTCSSFLDMSDPPQVPALGCPFTTVAQCVNPMPGLAMWWPYCAPPPPALSYALDSNALGVIVVALSAPPADPTLTVPSAMASAQRPQLAVLPLIHT